MRGEGKSPNFSFKSTSKYPERRKIHKETSETQFCRKYTILNYKSHDVFAWLLKQFSPKSLLQMSKK